MKTIKNDKEDPAMKLAEALQERADLNRRIEQLRNRLENSALVQEGERPAEAPEVLLEELEHCAARLEELMVRINLTNSRTMVDGLTLTELIAKKDCLSLKISVYRDLLQQAGQTTRRAVLAPSSRDFSAKGPGRALAWHRGASSARGVGSAGGTVRQSGLTNSPTRAV